MLLTVDNAKTSKGFAMGYYTGILYLAAHENSGIVNICPMADVAGCSKACLYKAGRGRFSHVQKGRIRKTVYYATQRHQFLNELARDIQRIANTARRLGMTPLIRLNGTSDIRWENQTFSLNLETAAYLKRYGGRKVEVNQTYQNLMELFPEIQFYDYSKLPTRNVPSNYDLTFSYSGVEMYKHAVRVAKERGMRIAVVFRTKEIIPKEFLGMRVIDGDDTDIRHLDPQGVVVSLYAKGPARKDTSGFVVSVS